MAENFDLIFGQNASQQYAWSDNDYQNGWETIGSIPPTAAQFDALQRRADLKAQDLNNRLAPIEENDTHDYRQPSATYAVGNIAYHATLPTGWYLECTAAGETGSGELTITNPTVGGAVSDGAVTWTIRKTASTNDITNLSVATQTTNGLMSATDKTKLDGIAAGANNYSLPAATGSVRGGVKVGSNISLSGDTISVSNSNVQNALGFNPAPRVAATQSAAGLMSATDKTKLDGIEANANNYALPAATGSVRGGVTIGSNISLSGDKISLTSGNVTNALGYTPPSTTGANASGSWNINSATATKLATPRTISLTGNASGSANFDGSGNVSINTTVNESKHAATASKLSTARKINITGNATGAAAFDGSGDISIDTTVNESKHAVKADTADMLVNGGDYFHAIIPGRTGVDRCEFHEFGAVWNFIGGSTSTTVASIQSDGFHGNVVGNAASATNADKLDGYHAADLLRTLAGNKAPVMTDIFDRAGTIDMTTMSAADKATHKANINKQTNVTQDLWNNTTGIHAYGGAVGFANGLAPGTLKLTQSYKNFDKILVVASNDDANYITYRIWNAWELAHAFNSCFAFDFLGMTGLRWEFYGTQQHGTGKFAWSTDTVLSCRYQNCGIIAIYGIKY